MKRVRDFALVEEKDIIDYNIAKKALDRLEIDEIGLDNFWHERNSLRMIDNIELLEDNNSNLQNLNLTYSVRDGIISHCGEVDDNGIIPRKERIDLNTIKKPGEYQAYTWEGCVVKISDKIAYLGRDIEDALRMNFID